MNQFRIFATIVLVASTSGGVLTNDHRLMAQDQPRRIQLAVLRLKSSQETPERKKIVKDFAADLTAALRENSLFTIPEDATVQKALKEEGMRPEGLLKQDQCYDVGKELGVQYVVVGSAMLQGLRWYTCVRVLSVQDRNLVATADAEYPVVQMSTMFAVLASKIARTLAAPPKSYEAEKNFTWKGESLLPFGKHRIDLEPPILLGMNADPPFELSIVAEMAVARTSNAVTNFEVFVDDLSLGSVHGSLSPPVPIKEREWTIGGCTYVFSLDLKEMRVFTDRTDDEESKFVTSARILIAARPRK